MHFFLYISILNCNAPLTQSHTSFTTFEWVSPYTPYIWEASSTCYFLSCNTLDKFSHFLPSFSPYDIPCPLTNLKPLLFTEQTFTEEIILHVRQHHWVITTVFSQSFIKAHIHASWSRFCFEFVTFNTTQREFFRCSKVFFLSYNSRGLKFIAYWIQMTLINECSVPF